MRTSETQATIRLLRLPGMTRRHYKTLSLTMKIQAQIMKGGVHRTDKRKLFLSPPGLNLFFSCDGIPHVTVSLEIHQPGHAVSFRKSRQPFFFMLSGAAFEVVGDPYVEDAGRACQNIDVIDHSVIPSASEESWLSSNLAESHETRRKTPVGRPVLPRGARPLPLRSLPLPILSFRAPAMNPGSISTLPRPVRSPPYPTGRP